tara:strand:- start:3684 stop:4724 length:1041 start_codon:yes stop_codon:yes gene_type:complete
VEVKKLIQTLGVLKTDKVLDPTEVIAQHGLEKVVETVEAYLKGLEYGIPREVSLEVFKSLAIETEKSIDQREITEEPQEKGVGDSENIFLNDSELHDLLVQYSYEVLGSNGVISLTVRDICRLSCVDLDQTNCSLISSHLDKAGFVSSSVADPTKFTRTRTKKYTLNLLSLPDLSELWSELGNVRDSSTLPIKITDFLDGTEDNVSLRQEGENFNLVVRNKNLLSFRSILQEMMEAVYETNDSEGLIYVENNGINRFLLAQALCHAFPATPIRRMVWREAGEGNLEQSDISATASYIRTRLKRMTACQGIFNEKWNLLDSSISGYVYLLSYMFLEYYIEEIKNKLD